MTLVTFAGEAPFALPSAQNASATARDGLVWVTFSVVHLSQGPEPFPVEIAMTQEIADVLGTSILEAAGAAAEMKARRKAR